MFGALVEADNTPERLGAWEADLDAHAAVREILYLVLAAMDDGNDLLIVRDQAVL